MLEFAQRLLPTQAPGAMVIRAEIADHAAV